MPINASVVGSGVPTGPGITVVVKVRGEPTLLKRVHVPAFSEIVPSGFTVNSPATKMPSSGPGCPGLPALPKLQAPRPELPKSIVP